MIYNRIRRLKAAAWLWAMTPAVALLAVLVASGTPAFAQAVQLPNNAQGTVDDSNPTTAFEIRKNYHKRYPFAKEAFNSDELAVVTGGGGNTAGGGGNTQTQLPSGGGVQGLIGAGGGQGGIPGLGGAGSGGGQGNNNQVQLKESVGPGEAHVNAYTFVIKFCDDNPYKGICYMQPNLEYDAAPATRRDEELFKNCLTTFGYPLSDTQFQLIERENNQRFLELLFDPERWIWLATNTSQIQGASAANSLAGVAESSFDTAANRIYYADNGGLINIANENSGRPTSSRNPFKEVNQAVWMVQQMYRFVFVPMALLFLLPGAVITQVKNFVSQGFNLQTEVTNPFEGILRAIVAVFLIPATQLIVSYSIDVGNSMAYSVRDWVDLQVIFDRVHEMSYNPPIDNVDNAIKPPAGVGNGGGAPAGGGATGGGAGGGAGGGGGSFLGGLLSGLSGLLGQAWNWAMGLIGFGMGGEGLAANVPEESTTHERQLWLSQILEAIFNGAMFVASQVLTAMSAYQLVFMCYLFLLGPISAALFAWPNVSQNKNGKYNGIFGGWLGAVITLSLWRFYWMVILAVMTTRYIYVGQITDLQWEVAIFTCFLGLMLYVPFNPFSFDPGQAFEGAVGKGSAMMQGTPGQGGQPGTPGLAQIAGNAATQAGAPQGAVQGALNQVLGTTNAMSAMSAGMKEGTGGKYGMDYSKPADQQSWRGYGGDAGVPSFQPNQPPPSEGQGGQQGSPPPQSGQGGGQGGDQQPPQSSSPPGSQQPQSAAEQSVQASNPNARVDSMPQGAPTDLSPGGGGGSGGGSGGQQGGGSQGDPQFRVNPSASPAQAQQGMQQMSQIASNVTGTSQSQAPPTSSQQQPPGSVQPSAPSPPQPPPQQGGPPPGPDSGHRPGHIDPPPEQFGK